MLRVIETNIPLPSGASPDYSVVRRLFAPIGVVGKAGEVRYRSSPELARWLRETVKDRFVAASLVGASESRYKQWIGGVADPDEKQVRRLQAACRITFWLEGMYNEHGILGWWDRQRAQLDGKTPMQLLRSDQPDALSILESLVQFP